MGGAYYNENDPKAAAWLRELIKEGHIADGEVDERSIEDVIPTDLTGFRQCHFFAGIGIWSHALRQVAWPDDRLVWTGSCPCQPFSTAGQGKGFSDERHLWPAFFWLIEQCRPVVCFGEQVAGHNGKAWLDLVATDLEAIGYTFGASITTACGFGAPHRRQRIYWLADSMRFSWRGDGSGQVGMDLGRQTVQQGDREDVSDNGDQHSEANCNGGMGNAGGKRQAKRWEVSGGQGTSSARNRDNADPLNGFWRNADWLRCRDEKFRPVEPRTFPLDDGSPEKVALLRGYGNALCSPQAEGFIRAYMEIKEK